MSLNYTFHWPAGPNDVKVTGTFDNWRGSLPLVKDSTGEFSITVPFSPEEHDRVLFKFIVDGEWKTSQDFDTVNEDGNENNVFYIKDLVAAASASSSKQKESEIPEAGGLASVTPSNITPTVLPSNEGKQTTLGEPGVVVPENAKDISAFKEVSTVDAKKLNERINNKEHETEHASSQDLKTQVLPSQEGKQTTLGEAGVVVPENANEIDAFKEVSDVNAKDLNAKLNDDENSKVHEKVEEQTSSDGKKRIKVKKVIKRNKVTGEEIVLSTEPVTEEDSKRTLDPKKTDGTEKASAKSAAPSAAAAAAAATASTGSPAKAPAVKKSSVPSAKKEDKKEEKKGFFRKLKKAFQ